MGHYLLAMVAFPQSNYLSILYYFPECLADGFLDGRIVAHLLVHVVERNQEMRGIAVLAVGSQDLLVQPVRLPHEPSEAVSVHRMFEQRFGCPDEYLVGRG